MTFKQTVEKILKTEETFLDTETKELNYTKVKDSADKIDPKLIGLLADHKETKEKFFMKVKDMYVFNINDFKFFLDENKINNSYTQFANQIGLSDGPDFLKDRGEVVLSFPYKDCVLEGGQSTEEGAEMYFEYSDKSEKYEEKEAKRSEVFFNQVLARDEIDRLFDKKALVNWKRYTKESGRSGETVKELERDENGTIKENLVIKGNNLLALHSLKSEFVDKVKLIYIDPPYNTGNDGFKYNDNFNHSTWLVFMKNRLEIAKDLLSDDGVIFVQCDDNEQAYLKILMDSIFKKENFVSQITWERSATAGLGLGGRITNVSEYILVYQKSFSENGLNRDVLKRVTYSIEDFKNYKFIEKIGEKKLINEFTSASGNPVKIYKHSNYKIRKVEEDDFKNDFDKIFRTFLVQKENSFQHSLISKMEKKELYSVEYTPSRGKSKNDLTTNYYYNGELFSWLKDLAEFKGGKIIKNEKVNDFWDRKFISNASRGEGGIVGIDRMKKPENLVSFIVAFSTKPNDIILDFFAGSGTTCAVAHKMKRQWIGIEQMDYIHDLPEARLINVINGDQTGISKEVNWQGGGSFIYCELAKWNEQAKEEINGAKDYKALEKMFDTLYEKYFFNYNVKIKEFKEKVLKEENFKKLKLDEQKRMFLTMLDLNQMYVQESEMGDKRFAISKEDQKLTKAFYSK